MNVEQYCTYLKICGETQERIDYVFKELEPKPWDLFVGVVSFQPGGTVIGGAHPGHASIIKVTDYRKFKRLRGKEQIGPDYDVWYVDRDDMDELIPEELLSMQQVCEDERESNRRSIYGFPYRLHDVLNMTVRVQGQECTRSKLHDHEIDRLESMLSQSEIDVRTDWIRSCRWAHDTATIEKPIRTRISGSDDGAMHKWYESSYVALHEARKLSEGMKSYQNIVAMGFFPTD